jgi:phosphoglycolate phosphatase-like HAD superfamily hydrolase
MFLHHEIELVHPNIPRGHFRSVLFDFDGTLSLIREGWPDIMIPMMVEVLQQTGTPETAEELRHNVQAFVMRLTGRQTIYQMIQLAEEVSARGGQPLDPLEYKHRYHERLMQRIMARLQGLATGAAAPDDWTVPGSRQLLESLQQRGMTLHLASGTDLRYVRHEADLLGLADFFGERIHGAIDDYKRFSKAIVIQRILADNNLHGHELLAFGDGFVEIEEVKRVGGVAIAVASNESARQGIDAWKRHRLLEAGADVVIPDYRNGNVLLEFLCDGLPTHISKAM